MKARKIGGLIVSALLALSVASTLLLVIGSSLLLFRDIWQYLETLFILSFIMVAILIFPYGYSCLVLIHQSRKYETPQSPSAYDENDLPHVTVQIPTYNERYVVKRIIEAVANIDYPTNRLQIQVLDDSTDETTRIAQDIVDSYSAKGLDIQLIHREEKVGFKAGALQRGLLEAKGDLIAVFDADSVPHPDFLLNTVPHFLIDAGLAWVQCRWEHINRDYNTLTRAYSFGMDGHFFVEQPARFAGKYTTNFCGTSGVIRKEAILAAGGWRGDILSEDLFLSYQLQLMGWRSVYLRDVIVPSEVPPTISSLKRQQGRWCKGTIQTVKCALVPIFRSTRLSFAQKILAAIHLTFYTVHPLLFLILVTSVPLIVSNAAVKYYGALWHLLNVFTFLCFLATPLMYLEGTRHRNYKSSYNAKSLLWLTFGGYGICISNTINWLDALFGSIGPFQRTPKYDIRTRADRWEDKKYHPPFPRSVLLELAGSFYAFFAIPYSLLYMNWTALPFMVIYFVGFLWVATSSIREYLARRGTTVTD